jgi:hypothetical protein
MTKDEIRRINEEQLKRWTEQMVAQHSTPLLIVGIGHDQHGGQLTVISVDNIDADTLAAYIRHAYDRLKT